MAVTAYRVMLFFAGCGAMVSTSGNSGTVGILPVTQTWRPIKQSAALDLAPASGISFPNVKNGPRLLGLERACSLHKAVLDQNKFPQFIQFKHHLPDLKEFTLCVWHKFYNHTYEQPLFSYSLPHQPKEILSWISNVEKQSYYMFAINGKTMYRLNYPVKLQRWYHTCQSWNGKTAEWQIWVNNERVGRGYYNILAGHAIKSGGVAISGQTHPDYSSRYMGLQNEIEGLQGEITMLNVYKAALTAGKAYLNHKHHHVHVHYHDDKDGAGYELDDETQENTDNGPPTIKTGSGFDGPTEDPLIKNGQLVHRLPIDQLLANIKKQPEAANLDVFVPINNALLFNNGDKDSFSVQHLRLFKRENGELATEAKTDVDHGKNISKIEKRIKRETQSTTNKTPKGTTPSFVSDGPDLARQKRIIPGSIDDSDEDLKRKSVFEEMLSKIPSVTASFPSFSAGDNSLQTFGDYDAQKTVTIEPRPSEKPPQFTEPAEWEVKMLANFCSGCSTDPFHKANVLSWQETPKKLMGGSMYIQAVPKCSFF
nr:PREDICTED: uncharacterized protein LOC109037046 isoform X2 [Bemisia tabaci]